MPKEPVFEGGESVEQKLIRLLREQGPTDPEARQALLDWTIAREAQVEQSADPAATIQLNLDRGRLYLSAGYVEEALANFNSAREQAWNEGWSDLLAAIEREMNDIADFTGR